MMLNALFEDELSLGVLLLALWSATIYIIRSIVDKSIDAKFEAYSKRFETRLDFEQKILSERYTLIMELSRRLEKVMTNLNRKRTNMPIPDGFITATNEIVPLTEIFEDLEINRLALTERFYLLFTEQAKLALRAANAVDSEWQEIFEDWANLRAEIRAATDEVFALSKIKMQLQ